MRTTTTMLTSEQDRRLRHNIPGDYLEVVSTHANDYMSEEKIIPSSELEKTLSNLQVLSIEDIRVFPLTVKSVLNQKFYPYPPLPPPIFIPHFHYSSAESSNTFQYYRFLWHGINKYEFSCSTSEIFEDSIKSDDILPANDFSIQSDCEISGTVESMNFSSAETSLNDRNVSLFDGDMSNTSIDEMDDANPITKSLRAFARSVKSCTNKSATSPEHSRKLPKHKSPSIEKTYRHTIDTIIQAYCNQSKPFNSEQCNEDTKR